MRPPMLPSDLRKANAGLEATVQRSIGLRSEIQRTGLTKASDVLFRAIAALAAEDVKAGAGAAYLRALRGDEATPMLLRAATTGAKLSEDSWAGVLASSAVEAFLLELGPTSAAAEIMALSMAYRLSGATSSISPLGIIPGGVAGAFVVEGAPIPVHAWSVVGGPLEPKRLAFISAFSRELARQSNAEQVIRHAMIQSGALVFDAGLFSNHAAAEAAPAGLLNVGQALPPSSAGGTAAMIEDLTALAASVAPIAAGVIVFVASPKLAVRIAIQAPRALPYPVFASAALAEGTVMAVAPRGLAFAVDPVPQIAVSEEALLHMDDAPSHISAPGSPATAAAPVQSMFQLAMMAIRFIATVSWTCISNEAVAYTTSADWQE